MRQRLRAVGFVALAIVAITCTDAPTSPTRIKPVPSGTTSVRMSPSFSAEAARIYSGLAAFGLEVTEVHVLLTGPDGTKKDTVIAFPVNQDQITIEIPVPASGTDQSFDALVELRNDQHVVLFSGHQTVIARAANLPTQTPPLVVINYTGPGKGTKTVSLSPPDTTIAGTATVGIKATAVDSAGLPVSNLLVRFAVSDATLAVATSTGDATGALTGLGKRGVATVSAITPLGVTGSSRITFVPPVARIVLISGNGQTGIAGSVLTQPLVVEVQATDNLPVPGAVVTFRAITAGGTVQQATVQAGVNGRASTTLTLGTVPGAYVYEAGSGALTPVSVSATATPAPAAAIALVSGDAQVDTVGKTLPLPFVVKVTDKFGGAVGGATVTWSRVAGNGGLGATSTTTAANGTTSIAYILGTTASNDTIRASVAGVATSVLFSAKSVSRSPATIAIVSGGNQRGQPNTTLATPLVARVSDAQNNPIAGATVTWSATGAGASFNPVSSLTDPTGQASTVAALGANSGTTTVTATVGTVTATTTLSTVGGNTFSILAGDQQSAVAGTSVALAPGVVLKDGLGNPIANAPVVFAVASGGGSITGATTTTNSFGVATVGSWTLGATPGPNTLTATSGTLSVTFTATGTSPAPQNHFNFVQPLPTQFVIGAPPVSIAVRLLDPANAPVSTPGIVATMTGTASPGPNFPILTATTDNTGTATFSVPTYNGPPGRVTITVSATGVGSVTSPPTPIVAPSASQILITTQPSSTVVNQAPFATQPVVQLADAAGNPVSTSGIVITATFASGPTTPTPVLSNATATTNASGQATFAGMSINGPFGLYRLSFSSALGATAAVSNTITNGAGPANTLLLFGGNGQNAPVSTPVGVPPIAKVIDAQGNGVPGVVVTFTAVNSGSTVSDGTTTGTTVTVTTNSFGNAQLTAWTMSPTAGPHTVTASATVPNGSPVTFTANATAAGASKFILLSPFPTQVVVGAPHPPINIQIADANNNPVQQANVSVNFNGNVQPGGFNFNFTLQTNAQGIINLTLSPYVGQIGNEIITISASGFTTVTSPAIPVVAGAASTIRITTQPPTTAQSGVLLSPQPVVRVVDDGNNPVSTAGIPINVNATGATVGGTTTINTNASGQAVFTDLFVSGPAGATSLQFHNPSLSPAVSTVINLSAGPAASMTIDAGNNQTVPAGSSVPILPAVLVKDAGGNPVAGVNVLFTAVTPNSYIDDVTSKTIQTNAQGIAAAQFFWQVSTTAGTNTLTASATGLANSPLTFTATGTPGPAANMKLLQAVPASITVGLPFPSPMQVQLVDGNGNNVAQSNTVITATVNVQPSNTSFGLNATTASNGVATFNVQPYIGAIGTMTFILSAPSINTLVTSGITVLAGAPNKLVITTQPPTSASSGVAFTPQPAVQVTDVGSNAVNATTNVLATIATGSGTLGGTTTIATNGTGLATYGNLALSGAPGSFTLRFAASGLTAVVSNNITLGAGGPSAITIVAGDQQVAAAGTSVAVAPSVRVTDGSGTPLAGVAVTFAPTLGGGSTPPGSVLTNASGIAIVGGWQLGTSVGTNNLSASVGALSATFTATAVAGPAARLAFITPPPPTAASGIALNPQPLVQLQDNFGNPVSNGGVQVTASVLSGSGTLTNITATTTTGGLATFSGLTITGPAGGVTLDFTAPSVTHIASSAITVSAGGPSAIAISAGNNQTAAAGATVATAPSVLVTDGAGNPVAGVQVTFTVISGSGLVSGTPATTNASGIATVGSWQLGNIAGANSLTASIGALSATFNATGVAGPPSQLTFNTQPPTSGTSGVALSPQPIIQLRDQFGNVAGGAGVTITAVITAGSGTLANQSATTVSGGLATFSGLAITGAGSFTLQFGSTGLTAVSSAPISVVGPAQNVVFSVQPTGGTGGIPFSPAVTVRLVDGLGNTVNNNTNSATLSIAPGSGTPGASLTGSGPVTFVNGVAVFPSAAIDFGGTNYVLRANTNALNSAGAPIPFASTNVFNLQPGTSQLLTTKPGTRVSVAAVGAQNPPTPTRPVFVARNAAGSPAPGLTVDVTAFGRCRLDNGFGLFTNLSYSSDANGEVTPIVRLPQGAVGAGCLIKATGATFTTSTDSSQIAVFPLQTSHVWTGAASNVWTNAANWIPVISVPSVPSSPSDNVFIPNYNPAGIPMVPVVSGAKPSMNRLAMDTAAQVSLNNIGIDIGAGGVTGFGFTNSGSIHLAGGNPVNATGIFDILDVGQAGSCGLAAPMAAHLQTVSANVLNVRCHTFIDSTGVSANTVNVFPNGGQGWLDLSSGNGGLSVSGNANFTGDSLWVLGGGIVVTGTTTFGGGGVNWSSGTFSGGGDVVFSSNHATYNGGQIIIQGNATFGGPASGQQNFAGGQLTLQGNFTQVTGIVGGPGGLTFTTSSDHVTVFAGTIPQTVSFANPTTSRFSVLRLQNQSAGGVQLTTNAQIINGTTQPRVDIITGRLQVNAGSIFTLNSGGLHLGLNSNLNLLGNIAGVGTCSGRTTNSATITGSGLYNGTAYSAATCTP